MVLALTKVSPSSQAYRTITVLDVHIPPQQPPSGGQTKQDYEVFEREFDEDRLMPVLCSDFSSCLG